MESVKIPEHDFHRWLGPTETFFTVMNHNFGMMSIAYGVFLESDVAIPLHLVKEALEECRRIHPVLQLAIIDTGTKFYFRLLPDHELPFTAVESKCWQEEYEKVLNTRYMYDSPLWQARFLPNPDLSSFPDTTGSCKSHISFLLLGFHHALTDGPANINICRNFLRVVNSRLSGEVPECPPVRRLPPSLEECMSKSVTPVVHGSGDEDAWPPSTLFRKLCRRIPKPGDSMDSKVRTHILPSLSKAHTDALRMRAKSERCSLNAVLIGSLAIAFRETLKSRRVDDDLGRCPVTLMNAVDTRRYYDDRNIDGCHNSVFVCPLGPEQCDKGNLWLSFRKITELSNTILKSHACWRNKTFHESMASRESAERHCIDEILYGGTDLCISNMGAVDGLSLPHLPVSVFRLLRNTNQKYLPKVQLLVVTISDRLMMDMDYWPQMVDEETMKIFGENLIKWLTLAVEQ